MLCRNKEVWPNVHTHQTVEESRRCWAGQYAPAPTAPVAASAPPPQPSTQTTAPAPFVDPVSLSQKNYIRDLGGDPTKPTSYMEAHEYINELKRQRYIGRPASDPRLKILDGMIDMVQDGYYATPPAERDKIDFVRITRPVRGKHRGCFLVQTKHAERWKEALIKWPSGSWSVRKSGIIEAVFLVVADTQSCRIRYAIECQRCHHCGTELTDARSRHYLIGPVCEKKYNLDWAIAEVDDKNNGMSFEELVSRGLPTRIWQERELTGV